MIRRLLHIVDFPLKLEPRRSWAGFRADLNQLGVKIYALLKEVRNQKPQRENVSEDLK